MLSTRHGRYFSFHLEIDTSYHYELLNIVDSLDDVYTLFILLDKMSYFFSSIAHLIVIICCFMGILMCVCEGGGGGTVCHVMHFV